MKFETSFPPEIINNHSAVQVSIYMETHRSAPDNKGDRLQFKNLMNDVLNQIEDKSVKNSIEVKLTALHADEGFWIHNANGLAILVDEKDLSVYRVNRTFSNLTYVGEHFNLKPLLRHFQSDDEYFVIGLSKEEFAVYKGNRYDYKEVKFDENLDMTKDEVLGTEVEGRTLNVVSSGGLVGNYHGHNARSEEEKIDTQRYFQYIDRFILKHLDNPNNRPIALLGLAEQQGEFRKISANPHIIDAGIEVSLESVRNDEKDLVNKIWKVIEPVLLEKTEDLLKRFYVNKEDESASSDVSEIAHALIEGRVDTLVLEDGKSFPNHYRALKDYKEGEDVLNIFLELANKTKAKVLVLPKEKMPDNTGSFAIYRY